MGQPLNQPRSWCLLTDQSNREQNGHNRGTVRGTGDPEPQVSTTLQVSIAVASPSEVDSDMIVRNCCISVFQEFHAFFSVVNSAMIGYLDQPYEKAVGYQVKLVVRKVTQCVQKSYGIRWTVIASPCQIWILRRRQYLVFDDWDYHEDQDAVCICQNKRFYNMFGNLATTYAVWVSDMLELFWEFSNRAVCMKCWN